jgi:hypothetical protein
MDVFFTPTNQGSKLSGLTDGLYYAPSTKQLVLKSAGHYKVFRTDGELSQWYNVADAIAVGNDFVPVKISKIKVVQA